MKQALLLHHHIARRLRRRAGHEPRPGARQGRRGAARVGVRRGGVPPLHGRSSGGQEHAASAILDAVASRTGAHDHGPAHVRRRGAVGQPRGGTEPWPGWWGDDPPFHAPVFVLTHHAREPLVLGGTTFTFVTDGIESALEQARAAAGDQDVRSAAGRRHPAVPRAGLVDEFEVHVAPCSWARASASSTASATSRSSARGWSSRPRRPT